MSNWQRQEENSGEAEQPASLWVTQTMFGEVQNVICAQPSARVS